jgi:quercetin dioxygenase-like cupin family protein
MPEQKSFDPVVLDPDKFKVRLENARVRVLEIRMPPGSRHAMHWHPEHLIYAITSYTVKDSFLDGTTKVSNREAGEVIWGEPITHAAENVGRTLVHALIIEFKK